MPDPETPVDVDLDSQLRGLFVEAAQQIQGRNSPVEAKAEPEKDPVRQAEEKALRTYASLPQLLSPMVKGLEAISRAGAENNALLLRLDKAVHGNSDAQRSLPQVVESLQALLEQKNGVNQKMFAALHEELKDYKDGFMMEAVLKPIVRDLIALLDDLNTIHHQMQSVVVEVGAVDAVAPGVFERLQSMDMNLGHHTEFVLEILARLDVNVMPIGNGGKLDKHTQRAVALEVCENPEDDLQVVQIVKRGFVWKDRLIRPEEVVVKKWKGSTSATLTGAGAEK